MSDAVNSTGTSSGTSTHIFTSPNSTSATLTTTPYFLDTCSIYSPAPWVITLDELKRFRSEFLRVILKDDPRLFKEYSMTRKMEDGEIWIELKIKYKAPGQDKNGPRGLP